MTKKRWFGRPPKAFQKLRHPKFMAGRLFDVWFMPDGRKHHREKVAVTIDPKKWEGALAYNTLDAKVRERFGDDLMKAGRAKLQITSRPDEDVVLEVRWSG